MSVSFPPELPMLKHTAATHRRDASQRLLAAVLILALSTALFSAGICLNVIAQNATTISLVVQAGSR
jgi:hypothetical protein